MRTSLLSLSLVALLIAGCSKTVTWNEEVQLSDGRIIVIKRETFNTQGGGEWARGGPGYHAERYTLHVEYPVGSGHRIEWFSTKKSSEYFNPESPLVLEIGDDALVIYSIVALKNNCEAYSKYVYQNGQWSEEVLPDEFPERETNLILRDAIEMPALVRVEDTQKNNRHNGYFRSLKKVGPKRVICGG